MWLQCSTQALITSSPTYRHSFASAALSLGRTDGELWFSPFGIGNTRLSAPRLGRLLRFPGARLIWIFEKLGWAYDVRWPDPTRLAAKHTGRKPMPVR